MTVMRSANPQLLKLGQRLLALEAPSGTEPGVSAAFVVCDRLRQSLSTLAGVAGFSSLLSRALALAGNEVGWLKAIHVNLDGTLSSLDESQLSQSEIAAGEAALVAQLLGLLVTFTGEALTLCLLQEVWPDTSFIDLTSEPENE